uniref:Crossover junction endonuclease MUS81-like HHH domain-containing protein n=1 Tax=Hyaloperonospora arabidopsidis (strain Emoy2) TaxID=559515 RepID=M4BKW1_HYAAE
MAKFGRNKRSHPSEKDLSNKKSKRGGENGGGDGGESVAAGYAYETMTKGEKHIAGGAGHVGVKAEDRKQAGQEQGGQDQGGREESMAPHKSIRLVEEAREKRAANSANQKIVDALANYGEEQLDRGHTGKGVSHLRAAIHIRDHPDAITSAKEARAVPMVGDKLASQIEEILATGKVKDDTADQNVSTNVDHHQRPQLVNDIFNSQAKCPENQVLVDELAKFGEHELYFGSSGKGTSHLRAAREIQLADHVVKSGSTARTSIPLVGDVIADKIDQIMEHGRIVQDTGETTGSKSYSRGSGGGYTVAPIVQDLRDKPAECPENQRIVDALIDYGDSHLYSGHRGKGISHLRAAQHIRDSKTVVKSGRQASKDIDMVGQRVAAKIDQILEQGHADSDEDYEYDPEDEEEEEGEYGERERDSVVPPIVQDVCSKRAQVEKNQILVDALVEYGEEELYKRHTGRGTAFLRAARRLRDADVEVNSGKDVKSIGIGDKVAEYIDTILAV